MRIDLSTFFGVSASSHNAFHFPELQITFYSIGFGSSYEPRFYQITRDIGAVTHTYTSGLFVYSLHSSEIVEPLEL